jgi:hypothetical protein
MTPFFYYSENRDQDPGPAHYLDFMKYVPFSHYPYSEMTPKRGSFQYIEKQITRQGQLYWGKHRKFCVDLTLAEHIFFFIKRYENV